MAAQPPSSKAEGYFSSGGKYFPVPHAGSFPCHLSGQRKVTCLVLDQSLARENGIMTTQLDQTGFSPMGFVTAPFK